MRLLGRARFSVFVAVENTFSELAFMGGIVVRAGIWLVGTHNSRSRVDELFHEALQTFGRLLHGQELMGYAIAPVNLFRHRLADEAHGPVSPQTGTTHLCQSAT